MSYYDYGGTIPPKTQNGVKNQESRISICFAASSSLQFKGNSIKLIPKLRNQNPSPFPPDLAPKMSDIPFEIMREILLRLPAESLFPFRSVCKEWRRIIDDPSFVKTHTTNNQLSPPNTLLIRNKTGAPLYLINLDSIDFTSDVRQMIDAIPVKQLVRTGVPRLRGFPATSCNGLILISSDDVKKIWAIWNPLTRECHQLPQTASVYPRLSLMTTGLGYDSAADDYKVVRIDRCCLDGVVEKRTLVYGMKSASWRRIKDCPYDFWCIPDGVFLNGALHWVSRDMIFVLDLGTEDYRQMTAPPVPTNTEDYLRPQVYLDAIGGCLTMSYYHYAMNRFTVWIMKDYGVEESWIKLFSIEQFNIAAGSLARLRTVAYLKEKRQVILQYDRGFCWLDVKGSSVKKVAIHGLSGISSGQICAGSLFRLDDSGSVAAKRTTGVKRKRMMKRKMVGTRLKFCVRDVADWYCSDSSCCSSEGED